MIRFTYKIICAALAFLPMACSYTKQMGRIPYAEIYHSFSVTKCRGDDGKKEAINNAFSVVKKKYPKMVLHDVVIDYQDSICATVKGHAAGLVK